MTEKEPAFPGGGPAFPIVDLDLTHPEAAKYMGLTKREIFAAMAMQGIISSVPDSLLPADVAEWSKEFADTLIAELEKE